MAGTSQRWVASHPIALRSPDTPTVNRRIGESRPTNFRNLARVVRPTRAIGVAAVLALAGH